MYDDHSVWAVAVHASEAAAKRHAECLNGLVAGFCKELDEHHEANGWDFFDVTLLPTWKPLFEADQGVDTFYANETRYDVGEVDWFAEWPAR